MPNSKRATHSYLLFLGVLLTLVGIIGLVYSSYPLGTQRGTNKVGGPGTFLQLEAPKSVRTTDSSIIRVYYRLSEWSDFDSSGHPIIPDIYEDITVTLQAPSFDVAPPSGQPLAKHIKNEMPQEWIWVIAPKQEGQQFVVLQFTGMLGPRLAEVASSLGVDKLPANYAVMDTLNWSSDEVIRQTKNPEFALNLVIPITVVDVLGLTAIQARVVSVITTVLGPALTLTWLYEQWQKQRSEKEKQKTSQRKQRKG